MKKRHPTLYYGTKQLWFHRGSNQTTPLRKTCNKIQYKNKTKNKKQKQKQKQKQKKKKKAQENEG